MDWELLKKLSETRAVPGREDAMRDVLREVMTSLVDELDVDVMGNLIGVKKGDGDRTVMIAAHMDEIGFYVKHIDEKGFLRLQSVGGFDPRQLFAQRVMVTPRTGESLPGVLSYSTKPTHILGPDESKSPPNMTNFSWMWDYLPMR